MGARRLGSSHGARAESVWETYMTIGGVEEMNERGDAHPRGFLRQVFGILHSRLPERLVAPMQKEAVEYLGCTRQIQKILRV